MKGKVEEHPTFGVSCRLWILLAKSPLKKKIYHATKKLGMGKIGKNKKFKHETKKNISHGQHNNERNCRTNLVRKLKLQKKSAIEKKNLQQICKVPLNV